MKLLRFAKNPYVSLVFNTVYALINCAVGLFAHSWWFITLGAYYVVLTVTRYNVLLIGRKAQGNYNAELFARRFTGVLLVVLSFCIVSVNILSALKERGTVFHEIVMITVATYTFTKITVAIIGIVKAKHSPSPVIKTLRNISLADACVSVYTMQRSMLRSFSGMEASGIRLFNILTGTAVWIIVLLLGCNLVGGKYINMAKSKIANINKKIAKAVVGGYKKIEKGVVGSYTKIEDKFVNAYLTKDGETVEEAKKRLKKDRK